MQGATSIFGSENGEHRLSKISKSSVRSKFGKEWARRRLISFSKHPVLFDSHSDRLDRREEEFETKRDYDDYLELKEELIMNLVFNTDVQATRRKLRDYAVANGIKTDTNDSTNEPTAKPVKRKEVAADAADPSGLIKGLKKIVVPKAKAPYDPFMGMARTRDYYEVKESYVARARGKPADAMSAAGYDFHQYVDECLLRAFAGFGVFIEDEMGAKGAPVSV